MNILKERESEARPYLSVQLDRLYYSYTNENLSPEDLKKMLNFIAKELKRPKQLTKAMLDDTYREVLENFTLYRRFNASTYMTAFKNVTRK